MGTFRIEIQAVGGHGCQREIKDGGTVNGCGQPNCPDCLARDFVQRLKAAGVFFGTAQLQNGDATSSPSEYARLTHWPGQPGEVRDDLLTATRSGSF